MRCFLTLKERDVQTWCVPCCILPLPEPRMVLYFFTLCRKHIQVCAVLLPGHHGIGTLQVTCGGLQSAHCAAVAALCAERGLHAHLLVRGERPSVPAGCV